MIKMEENDITYKLIVAMDQDGMQCNHHHHSPYTNNCKIVTLPSAKRDDGDTTFLFIICI